jgi:hypothetical protein
MADTMPVAEAVAERDCKQKLTVYCGPQCPQICGGITILAVFVILLLSLLSHWRLEQFEQIMVADEYGDRYTIEEPGGHWIPFWEDVEKRTADALGPTEYAITYDTFHITKSVVHGPARLWLGAYEEVESKASGVALSVRDYIKVTNSRTKGQKVVRGDVPCGTAGVCSLYRPEKSAMTAESNGLLSDDEEQLSAYEEIGSVRSATQLNPQQYVAVTNDLTMTRKIVRGIDGPDGNGLLYMPCADADEPAGGYLAENDPCSFEEIGEVQIGVTLTQQEYVAVTNSLDGSIKIVRGVDGPGGNGLLYLPCSPSPGEAIPVGDPCAYEDIGRVQTAVMLTPHQVRSNAIRSVSISPR